MVEKDLEFNSLKPETRSRSDAATRRGRPAISIKLDPAPKKPPVFKQTSSSKVTAQNPYKRNRFGFCLRRYLAFQTDFLWMLACTFTFGVVWMHQATDQEVEQWIQLSFEVVQMCGMLWLQAFWMLQMLQETLFGGSFGQRLFGLVLTGGWLQRFTRAALFPISALCFGPLKVLCSREQTAWAEDWSGARLVPMESL